MTTWGEKPPIANTSGSIHDMVVEDIKSRKALGLAKYGTILQANNGRNALKDAYEEVLDLTCYLRQKLEEINTPDIPHNLVGASVDIFIGGKTYFIKFVDIAKNNPAFLKYQGADNMGNLHFFNPSNITYVHKR